MGGRGERPTVSADGCEGEGGYGIEEGGEMRHGPLLQNRYWGTKWDAQREVDADSREGPSAALWAGGR